MTTVLYNLVKIIIVAYYIYNKLSIGTLLLFSIYLTRSTCLTYIILCTNYFTFPINSAIYLFSLYVSYLMLGKLEIKENCLDESCDYYFHYVKGIV